MFRRSRILAYTAVCALCVFTLLRLLLLIQNWALVPHEFWELAQTFLGAIRFDIAVVGVLGLPGALWVALRKERIDWSAAGNLSALLFLFWFIFLYLTVADGFFFAEFNAHFNYVAVDYIFVNGHEVLQNIWQSYPVIPISIGIAIGAALLTAVVLRLSLTRPTPRLPQRRPGLFLIWLLATGAALASVPLRGSPARDNRLLGELSTNGFFTLGYALVTNDLAYGDYYLSLPEAETLKRVRDRIIQPDQQFLSPNGTERHIPGSDSPQRLNVVVILEESFGSEFIDALYPHDPPLTPEFSRLAQQGLFFNHVYATGNRTVRGLEGVLASFPPIPGASIVKRKPERPIPTLATVLKAQGYHTSFIYGGRGAFDNLRSFAQGNGFDVFIEQKDFQAPAFTTAWGVSDEDIFKKADETFDALSHEATPFFSGLILTVSNHRPYLYPKGRIDLDPAAQRREHAVKYADWAIGEFFKSAKEKAYFKNTLFVLLGDHGARVYGADFIPLFSYEIPLVFYAPGLLEPRTIPTLGGSMDVAPTILGVLGMPYDSPFFGRDLMHVPEDQGYALMQHDRDLGLFDGHRLAVLSTPKSASFFTWNPEKKTFTAVPQPDLTQRQFLDDAVSFYQTGYRTFEQALKK